LSDERLVAIDLTHDERQFVVLSINEWSGSAHGALLLLTVFGLSTKDEFDGMVIRLRDAIALSKPLSDLDWARALLLTEISWGSTLLGADVTASNTNFRDPIAVELLRSIQYKISSGARRQLLEAYAGLADSTGETR
jgi:hypothetical protein